MRQNLGSQVKIPHAVRAFVRLNEQSKPFLYGRPVELADGLIDRENERAELLDCVRSGQAVMVYGLRRYGKTSLARLVEQAAADEWRILAVHADLWGVNSIADIVEVLGRAYARVSEFFRGARRAGPPSSKISCAGCSLTLR